MELHFYVLFLTFEKDGHQEIEIHYHIHPKNE